MPIPLFTLYRVDYSENTWLISYAYAKDVLEIDRSFVKLSTNGKKTQAHLTQNLSASCNVIAK